VIRVLSKLPAFHVARRIGKPLVLPASLTVSVLYACNSRCKSCRIYENKSRVLNLDEYRRIFRSLGRSPRWVTISGGEPFLRKDLAAIATELFRAARPAILNFPTNGSLPERVLATIDEVAALSPDLKIVVNVSLDQIGKKHDELRGLDDNYARAMETLAGLKRLRRPNVTVGVHTVISRHNEHDFTAIADHVLSLEPDSYIAEVAERRVELGTANDEALTPSREGVLRAIAHLRSRMRRSRTMIEALVSGLRSEYYDMLASYTERPREILPCYAAITSAHIMPEGKVWACCVLGETLGELRDVDYDFPTIWWSAAANRIRARIKRERCHCPLANQSYLNTLVDPRSLVRASARAATSFAWPASF
jgi:MoaA/NifB/PqqE/SkfB family radical SAM enzyme